MAEDLTLPFEPEAIAATLAFTAAIRGDAASVMALSVSRPTIEVVSVDFGGSDIGIVMYLELPALQYALLTEHRDQIQDNLSELLEPIVRAQPAFWLKGVSLLTSAQTSEDSRMRDNRQ